MSRNVWADCKLRPQNVNTKKYDRRPKEQFVNGLNNEIIIAKLKKELTAIKKI